MTTQPRTRRLFNRFLGSLAVAATVMTIAYLIAWRNHRGYHYFLDPQWMAQRDLDTLRERVEEQRANSGTLPDSLADLENRYDGQVRIDEAGHIVDIWQRPIQYEITDEGYSLFSLGRDGKLGGEGLDADIYPTADARPRSLPTLRQFTFDLSTGGIQSTCVLAGVCAGLIYLRPFRKPAEAEPTRLASLVPGLVTITLSVIVAMFLCVLHLPTGH